MGKLTTRTETEQLDKERTMITRIAPALLVLLALACSDSEVVKEHGASNLRVYLGKDTLEKRIIEADVIARVSLLSHSVVGVQHPGRKTYVPTVKFIFPGRKTYIPAIVFTFRAHEYLKGSGGRRLTAYAYGDHHYFHLEESSAKEAMSKWGDWIRGFRDGRFDGRQAIVFLKRPGANGPYQIGNLGEYEDLTGRTVTHRVTVADEESQVWLPAASAASSPSISSLDQRFLTEDVTSGGGAYSASTSITLSALKNLIASVQAELSANPSDAYRQCLIDKHTAIGKIRDQSQRGIRWTEDFEVAAGRPAYTRVGDTGFSQHFTIGREWLVGLDKDLFTAKNSVIYTTGPLKAGEYRFYYNFLKAGAVDCGRSQEQNTELLVIVTAK